MSDTRKVDSGIVQRGRSYRFTVACGMDSNGKQIRKTMSWAVPEGVTQNKADKLAKLRYAEFKIESQHLHDDNMKFSVLVDKYFENAEKTLKVTTVYEYRKNTNKYFIPVFGNKKLRDIKKGVITDFFNALEDKLKQNTLKLLKAGLQNIFQFAVMQGYLDSNPCKNIRYKSSIPENGYSRYIEENDLSEFLSLFDGSSDIDIVVKFLLYTGMRSGECLGLTWEKIDFDNRTITIDKSLAVAGDKRFLSTPKTKTSIRTIGMSETTYKLLYQQLMEQRKKQFCLGKSFEHPEMVFTSANGGYKSKTVLNDQFRRRTKGTKFEHLTIHCLRHSNATFLLNSGVDIKIISEHLGHHDIETTANVYADVLESSKRKTAEILEFKIKQA